jgi:ketosteroid isomerase-like protein
MSGPARSAAEAYCAAVYAGDLEGLRRPFAEDVTALSTMGEYRGRAELLGFYEQLIFTSRVKVEASHTYEAGTPALSNLRAAAPTAPSGF